ncbi:MAG: hypothetical protein AAGL89_17950 [Pseudomonadota bacterium]
MQITQNSPDLLVLRFTRWKAPLGYALATVGALLIGVRIAYDPDLSFGILLFWLLLTVSWLMPMALLLAERSMLVLDGRSDQAILTHRTITGLHRQAWPLDEVQSTRVTRFRPHGPAAKDPKRMIALLVREGMDKGRHKLANHPVAAKDALAASALISEWMKAWRALDSSPPQA